ncbi:hypothetical protein DFH07DRAFT_1019374 [Mycena maculata]|uniref:Uncharacterized protein n=1 Tax=Mycena maculata TaxID=230809 RepID=A0AAD7H5R1_9AGAR|nr:hypothetical protein DFH07DRAFT_1019374 [Mycena maculata]
MTPVSPLQILLRVEKADKKDVPLNDSNSDTIRMLAFEPFLNKHPPTPASFFLSQLLTAHIGDVEGLWKASALVGLTYDTISSSASQNHTNHPTAHFSKNWGFLSLSPMVGGNLFSIAFGRKRAARLLVTPSAATSPSHVRPSALLQIRTNTKSKATYLVLSQNRLCLTFPAHSTPCVSACESWMWASERRRDSERTGQRKPGTKESAADAPNDTPLSEKGKATNETRILATTIKIRNVEQDRTGHGGHHRANTYCPREPGPKSGTESCSVTSGRCIGTQAKASHLQTEERDPRSKSICGGRRQHSLLKVVRKKSELRANPRGTYLACAESKTRMQMVEEIVVCEESRAYARQRDMARIAADIPTSYYLTEISAALKLRLKRAISFLDMEDSNSYLYVLFNRSIAVPGGRMNAGVREYEINEDILVGWKRRVVGVNQTKEHDQSQIESNYNQNSTYLGPKMEEDRVWKESDAGGSGAEAEEDQGSPMKKTKIGSGDDDRVAVLGAVIKEQQVLLYLMQSRDAITISRCAMNGPRMRINVEGGALALHKRWADRQVCAKSDTITAFMMCHQQALCTHQRRGRWFRRVCEKAAGKGGLL